MVVEQGRLSATDTGIDMASFYSDAIVDTVTDVNRILHDNTQFIRLVLRRPQPVTAGQGSVSSPDSLTDADHIIDGSFIANPSSGVDLIRVGFILNQLVSTTIIRVYSVKALDSTLTNWEIATSLDGTDSEFNLTNFKGTITSITEQAVVLSSQAQFKYTITFTAPSIGGLRYWRVKRLNASPDLSETTEIEIIDPLTPTMSFFDSSGSFVTSKTFEKSNILDAVFDNINRVFYTIRFNTDNVGSTSLNFSDTFDASDSGTASGTNNFNPARWVESSQNAQFLRLNDELVYNVAAGDGQLETTYTVLGDADAQLFIDPKTISTKDSWLVLRALDSSNNTIMSEGFGYDNFPTVTGIVFSSYINSLINTTNNCNIREIRPQYHNTTEGTDSFTLTFNGSIWAVTGTLTGALNDATTGVTYNESIDPTTPIDFLVSCNATPGVGEKFTFDLVTVTGHKNQTVTGTVGFNRTGSNYTTRFTISSPVPVSTDAVSVEIYGNTATSVNFSANDYVLTGAGIFPNLAVFTVEKTDTDGLTISPPLIDSFDIVGDASKTYNDFLDGKVQITTAQSGTGGGQIYIKINNRLFKYDNNISLGIEDSNGSSAIQTSTGQLPTAGTSSFNWTHKSAAGGLPFLTYIEFDTLLEIIQLRTLDKDTLQDMSPDKEARFNISNYSINDFKLFFDGSDLDSLRFVDASTNLQTFDLDDRISAFMAVNALDTTLPAGTALQTLVNADVINAWGESLNGKVVTFTVSAGDGAVTPATDTTAGAGRASTQFVVGSNVGISVITASVSES